MVLVVIFAEDEESGDAAPAAPTATETATPTMAVTSVPTATPTPTPAPTPVVAICPDDWDLAGDEFSYYPAEKSRLDAISDHCGTLSPIEGVCPEDYRNAGNAYTFDPDDTSLETAVFANCGKRFQRGRWVTRSDRDVVDSSVTIKYAVLGGKWIGTPDWLADDEPTLAIGCSSKAGLQIAVFVGGYISADIYTDVIKVEYSFNRTDAAEGAWNQSTSNDAVVVPRQSRAHFVSKFRANSEDEFVIRFYQFDRSVYGTASFNLTGIELRVEPVFEACGW